MLERGLQFPKSILTLYYNAFKGLSRDIWILSAVTFINRAGAMVLPFLTVYLNGALSFSLKETGWIVSCFGLGSILGTYAGGWLTDRFGYYKVQLWSLLLAGGMFFVLMYMNEFYEFCIVIFLTSTIADAFRPASMVAIGVYSKPENRTRSVSLIRFAINLGFAAGPAVGGLLISGLGYYALFLIDGITCILAAIFFRFSLVPHVQKAKETDISNKENNSIKSEIPLISAYKDQIYMIFIVCQLICGIAFIQWFSTVPVFLKNELLMEEKYIGMLLALNGLMIVILEMPLIYVLEKKYNTLYLVSFGMICVALSYLTFQFLPWWIGWILASVILLTIGEIIMFPFGNSFALNRSKLGLGGQYMGLYTMTFSIAHVLAPTIGMGVAEWKGFYMLWVWMALFGVIGFIGIIWLKWYMERSTALQ